MKSTFKVLGIIALLALALAGCSKKAPKSLNDALADALVDAAVDTVLAQAGGSAGGSTRSGTSNAVASDYTYDLSSDGKGIKINKFTGNAAKVVVPNKIEEMPVVEIGESAFSVIYSGEIVSITIPNTVKIIGEGAFSRTGITSFTIPDSVIKIGWKTSSIMTKIAVWPMALCSLLFLIGTFMLWKRQGKPLAVKLLTPLLCTKKLRWDFKKAK